MVNKGSATGNARSISRLLKANGIPKCDTSDSSNWSEGFKVETIGVGTSVSAHYIMPINSNNSTKAIEMNQAIRHLLIQSGYVMMPHASIAIMDFETR